jgi:hypothetical protein
MRGTRSGRRFVVGIIVATAAVTACAPIAPAPPPPPTTTLPPQPPTVDDIEVSPSDAEITATPHGPPATQIFTVTNHGSSTTEDVLWAFFVDEDGVGDFSEVSDSCWGPLGPGASCTVAIRYTNLVGSGERVGAFVISATLDEELVDASLTGVGAPGGIDVDIASARLHDSPDAPFGFANVTVTNTSAQSALITSTIENSSGAGSFSIASVPAYGFSCDTYPTLPGGYTCTVPVRYENPTGAGTGNATLAIDAGALGHNDVDLEGDATDEALSIDGQHLSFGDWPTPRASAPQTITIANEGSTSTGLLDVNIYGLPWGSSGNGYVTIVGDTCSGAPLPAGTTCAFDITYTNDYGSGSGRFAAAVHDTTGIGGDVFAIVDGEGLGGFTVPNPPSTTIDAPQTPDGDISFSVTHRGATTSEPLEVQILSPSGVGSWELFERPGTECIGEPLSAFGSCEVHLRYRNNTGSGTGTALVRVARGLAQPAEVFTVTGRGQPSSAVQVNATDVVIEDTPGSPGPVHTITVTNAGSSTLEYFDFIANDIGGTGTFTLLADTCNNPTWATIEPGASCSMTYRYDNDTGAGSKEKTIRGRPRPGSDGAFEVRMLGQAG